MEFEIPKIQIRISFYIIYIISLYNSCNSLILCIISSLSSDRKNYLLYLHHEIIYLPRENGLLKINIYYSYSSASTKNGVLKTLSLHLACTTVHAKIA